MGHAEGVTKMRIDRTPTAIVGMDLVGPHAGDLIAEAVLAKEPCWI